MGWRRFVPRLGSGAACVLLGLALGGAGVACAGGCESVAANIALGAVGGTALLAQAPGHDIEQVYYLGVFDPRDQLVPPQVYRLIVRGQSSSLSGMKFGSGWVHASVIDSLNSRVTFDQDSERPKIDAGEDAARNQITPGRRLMMFGPEGFREAPKDHRLVIVMGQSPEKFFAALDQSIGIIAQASHERIDPAVTDKLVAERRRLEVEQQRLADRRKSVDRELPATALK